MKRRQFIKKAIAGLAFVGMYLKSSFLKANEAITLEEQNLQKQFGKDSMCLDGVNDFIEVSEEDIRLPEDFTLSVDVWHHFVADMPRCSGIKVYIDGKLYTGSGLGRNIEIFPGSIQIETTRDGMIEKFWFRNKDNG